MIVAREHGRFIYLDEPTVLYHMPASVEANLKRRRVWNPGAENTESMRVKRYARNSELMQRLVRERFGDRAARLIDAIQRATSELLISVGLTAMLDYDRMFARRCCRLALHNDRFDPKTYVRLGWTYLPERVARTISAALPSRLQRAVSGPAHAGI